MKSEETTHDPRLHRQILKNIIGKKTCTRSTPNSQCGSNLKKMEMLITNHNPISVLPVVSKIFERLMYIKLTKYVTKNNSLSNSQFGF